MARDPTRAQIRFATAISEKIGVAMPDIRTRQSLFIYIRTYRPEFEKQRRKESCERHNARVAAIAYESENEDQSDYPDSWMDAAGLDEYTGGFTDNC